jgi:hypothetical protein
MFAGAIAGGMTFPHATSRQTRGRKQQEKEIQRGFHTKYFYCLLMN